MGGALKAVDRPPPWDHLKAPSYLKLHDLVVQYLPQLFILLLPSLLAQLYTIG